MKLRMEQPSSSATMSGAWSGEPPYTQARPSASSVTTPASLPPGPGSPNTTIPPAPSVPRRSIP